MDMEQTISLDTIVGFLVSTPFFDRLDPAERAEVVRIMEVQRLTDGEEVFHEGDAGDAWCVILEGEARVLKDAEGGMKELAVLKRGACVGEMAILDGEGRSATVKAVGPLTLLRFRRSRFEQLLNLGSLGAYKLVLAMARMLSQRHRRLTARLSTLASKGDSIAEYQISE
jgi:CRP/FNR family transcriptional regulator, cyclic AMP receptor protein